MRTVPKHHPNGEAWGGIIMIWTLSRAVPRTEGMGHGCVSQQITQDVLEGLSQFPDLSPTENLCRE